MSESNLLRVSNGKIQLAQDAYGRTKSLSAYVCRPDRSVICGLNGTTSFGVSVKFNDISEVNFEVSRYINLGEENPSYKYIHAFCGIQIPELGYFYIPTEPKITAESTNQESKSFTVYSYECTLQYENALNLVVNQGTETSLEMYPGNTDANGSPISTIQFYNQNEPRLSLLDLILEYDNYGWSIGYIDESLKRLSRSFDISSQNLYSIFRGDVQKAFRCIFVFNSIDKTINAYAVETVGNSTNIYLSFDHLINTINVSPETDDIYTVFNVAGDNDLDISMVNFGSNKIVNIDYPISFLDSDIQDAYELYETYRDSQREAYTSDMVRYSILLSERNSITDRQPQDIINNNWSSTVYYSLSDLRADLVAYQAIVDSIELLYQNDDGSLDTETLNKSEDASLYYSYKEVVIPDITAEIARREEGGSESAERVDSDVIWELYGLYDLEVKLEDYKNRLSLLSSYSENEWSAETNISEETWEAHKADYEKYSRYVTQLETLIAQKQSELDEIDAETASLQADVSEIGANVNLATWFENNGYPSEYSEIITSLYRESDYQDENYTITEYDDTTSKIATAQELYNAAVARLEIESRPQLTWGVDSANLFAIEEFKLLRNQLQVGDFITLGYYSEYAEALAGIVEDDYGVSYKDEQVIIESNASVSGETIYLNGQSAVVSAEAIVFLNKSKTVSNDKFRVVEISFDALNMNDDFSLTFSNVTATRTFRNDYEDLLENAITSSVNSITTKVNASTTDIVNSAINTSIRPYIAALRSDIATSNITTANLQEVNARQVMTEYLKADLAEIDQLDADSAFIRYLQSDVITADAATISTLQSNIADIKNLVTGVSVSEYATAMHLTADNATIDSALINDLVSKSITVFDLAAANITASKTITLVRDEDGGSIVLNNSTMQFLDENDDVRVQIGKDANGNYSLAVFSEADAQGNQTVLWGSDGITADAIANGLIVTDMLGDDSVSTNKVQDRAITADKIQWSGIYNGVDENGESIFSAGHITINGQSLETEWEGLKTDVAGITLNKSADIFSATTLSSTYYPSTITITPVVHLIQLNTLKWSYSTNGSNWTSITRTSTSTTLPWYDSTTRVLSVPSGFTQFTDTVKTVQFKCESVVSGSTVHQASTSISKLRDGESSPYVSLSMDSFTIATDEDLYPVASSTKVCFLSVYMGTDKYTGVSSGTTLTEGKFSYTVSCSDSGISVSAATDGQIDISFNKTKAINSSGSINVVVSIYGISETITKTISYSVAGAGASTPVYKIVSDYSVFNKSESNVVTPSTVTLHSKYQIGDTAPVDYSGAFTVEATTNNESWTNIYKSTTLESSCSFNSSSTYINYRCRLWKTVSDITSGGYMDQITIPVVADGKMSKLVRIVASNENFISYDYDGTTATYVPSTITLTPVFQGDVQFSKWQYSLNGSSYSNVTSGSHGLTLNGQILSVSSSTDLFTDERSVITFRVMSNDSSQYAVQELRRYVDPIRVNTINRTAIEETNEKIALIATEEELAEFESGEQTLATKVSTVEQTAESIQTNLTENIVAVVDSGYPLWDSQNTYTKDDIVTYNGMLYKASVNVPSGIDIENTSYWTPLRKGYNLSALTDKIYSVEETVDGIETTITSTVTNILETGLDEWSSSNTYTEGIRVIHDGKIYEALKAVPENIAITNTSYWVERGSGYNLTALSEQVNTNKSTAEGNTSRIAAVETNLANNYKTTSQVEEYIRTETASEVTERMNSYTSGDDFTSLVNTKASDAVQSVLSDYATQDDLTTLSTNIRTDTADQISQSLTNYSTTTQTQTMIEQTAGEITQTAMENFVVGGHNLFRDTKNLTNNTEHTSYPSVFSAGVDENGVTTLYVTGNGETAYRLTCYITEYSVSYLEGKRIAVSFDASSEVLASHPEYFQVGVGLYTSDNTRQYYKTIGNMSNASIYNVEDFIDSTETDKKWVRVKCFVTLLPASKMSGSGNEYVKYGIYIGYVSNLEGTNGTTVAFRKPQAEFGSTWTDWRPSNYDVDEMISSQIDDVNESINEDISRVTSQIESINNLIGTSEDSDDSNTILGQYSTISQTTRNLTLQFNTLQGDYNNLTSDVENLNALSQWFAFDSERGLVIGRTNTEKPDEAFYVQLSQAGLIFYQGGLEETNQVAYMTQQKLYITDASIVSSINIGNFAFVPRTNGNLSFRYVGGEGN